MLRGKPSGGDGGGGERVPGLLLLGVVGKGRREEGQRGEEGGGSHKPHRKVLAW